MHLETNMLHPPPPPPPQTDMTMENPPFEDVFPIEHGIFQFLLVSWNVHFYIIFITMSSLLFATRLDRSCTRMK